MTSILFREVFVKGISYRELREEISNVDAISQNTWKRIETIRRIGTEGMMLKEIEIVENERQIYYNKKHSLENDFELTQFMKMWEWGAKKIEKNPTENLK